MKNKYQTNIRKDVINFIEENKINPTNILEIGGGGGFTAGELCKKFHCNGTNIDINIPKENASNIDHIKLDMSKDKLNNVLESENFDLILALDVLEHIESTQDFMESILEIIKKETYIIFSLPNIKNIRVPYQIYIKNTFPRNEQGIFDKTHLRWFTKKDIKFLLRKYNFNVIKSCYTDHRSILIKNKLLEKLFGFLIAPQFIVLGKFKNN